MDGMYRWHGANTNNDDENNQDVDSRSHISSSHASCMMGIMRYTLNSVCEAARDSTMP